LSSSREPFKPKRRKLKKEATVPSPEKNVGQTILTTVPITENRLRPIRTIPGLTVEFEDISTQFHVEQVTVGHAIATLCIVLGKKRILSKSITICGNLALITRAFFKTTS
jgi:hypothetical protein